MAEKIRVVPVLSDPAARKTVEGLLSLLGLPAADAERAREEGGPLCWIFDAETAETMEGAPAPGETVFVLRRPEDPGSPSDLLLGRRRLDTPLLLSEAAEEILSAVHPAVRPAVRPAVSPAQTQGAPRSAYAAGKESPEREDGIGTAAEREARGEGAAAVPRDPPKGPKTRETPDDPETRKTGGETTLPRLEEGTRTVEFRGQSVRLTPKEFAVFRILYERRGEAVPRGELSAVFPESAPGSNPADVYAGYLRRRLRPLFGDGAVLSVRGKGYLFRLPGEEVRFDAGPGEKPEAPSP